MADPYSDLQLDILTRETTWMRATGPPALRRLLVTTHRLQQERNDARRALAHLRADCRAALAGSVEGLAREVLEEGLRRSESSCEGRSQDRGSARRGGA